MHNVTHSDVNMFNLHIKQTEISQKRSKETKNCKRCYFVLFTLHKHFNCMINKIINTLITVFVGPYRKIFPPNILLVRTSKLVNKIYLLWLFSQAVRNVKSSNLIGSWAVWNFFYGPWNFRSKIKMPVMEQDA